MRVIGYQLIGDGTSDRALLPIVAWVLRALAPHANFAEQPFRHRGSTDIATAIAEAKRKYQPDLIFVHRDAERLPLQTRRSEIPTIDAVVPVVPVRMTEAWLLIDADALRRASGNPNGTMPLALPRLKDIEGLPDPKKELEGLLLAAAGASGPRRRKRFQQDQSAMVHRVAEYIENFAMLRSLDAFAVFWADLEAALRKLLPRT